MAMGARCSCSVVSLVYAGHARTEASYFWYICYYGWEYDQVFRKSFSNFYHI